MSEQKKLNVVPVVMMFLLFAMIAFVTNLCNPMGVIVKSQFHLSNFEAQLGNLANFIAYLVMGIPAGLLLKKIGYKNTALLAIAIGFVGVFLEYMSGWDSVQSFWVYLLGAFIAGFCMCMLNTVVNPMLNTIGGGGNKGNQLVQFGGVCNSLAATAVTIFGGALIGDVVAGKTSIKDVTPALMIALAIFAVVFVVLLIARIPEPATNTKESNAGNTTTGAFKYRHFCLGLVAIFLYMGVEVGFPTYVNQYLTTTPNDTTPGLGVSAAIAGAIAGVYWLLMLCGRFIGGIISGKVSSRTQITVVSTMVILCTLVGMFGPEGVTVNIQGAQIPVHILAFIAAGLFTSVMWGGIFNLSVEGLGKYTEAASGIFMMMVVGGGVMPLIQDFIAQSVNPIFSYWLVVAMLAYILYYALIGCKNVNKDIPVE